MTNIMQATDSATALLAQATNVERVRAPLLTSSVAEALGQMCELLAKPPAVMDAVRFEKDLRMRNAASGPIELTTGIALAHVSSISVKAFSLAIGRLEPALVSDSGRDPLEILLVLASPVGQPANHLAILASLARRLSQPARKQRLLAARSAEELLKELLANP